MDLILDIKILIARFDQETWIKWVLYDDVFHEYAYSPIGKRMFISEFTKYQCDFDIGCRTWKLFDKLHRNDGPSIIYSDGECTWYQNDQRHRIDGPAVIAANGNQYWYQNDKLHRIGGPAVVKSTHKQRWFQNGKLHRDIGPAVHLLGGYREWYRNGVYIGRRV